MSRIAYKCQRCQTPRRLRILFHAALILVALSEIDFVPQIHAAVLAAEQGDGEPIPVEEVAAEAETASARLRDIRAELSSDERTGRVQSNCPCWRAM